MMAEFKGKRCDECDTVYPKDQNTEVTTRFQGPQALGEFVKDLCPKCADEAHKDVQTGPGRSRPMRIRQRKGGGGEVGSPLAENVRGGQPTT